MILNELSANLTELAGLVAINTPAAMDPVEVAKMYSAQLPDELPPVFEQILFSDNLMGRAKMLAPKIGATPEIEAWFAKFFEAIKAVYSEAPNPPK